MDLNVTSTENNKDTLGLSVAQLINCLPCALKASLQLLHPCLYGGVPGGSITGVGNCMIDPDCVYLCEYLYSGPSAFCESLSDYVLSKFLLSPPPSALAAPLFSFTFHVCRAIRLASCSDSNSAFTNHRSKMAQLTSIFSLTVNIFTPMEAFNGAERKRRVLLALKQCRKAMIVVQGVSLTFVTENRCMQIVKCGLEHKNMMRFSTKEFSFLSTKTAVKVVELQRRGGYSYSWRTAAFCYCNYNKNLRR